jgi:hypothetical protein
MGNEFPQVLTEPIFANDILYGSQAEPLQGIYEESETQNFRLGTLLVYPDGRKFRYARNGAVALSKALMTQSEANDAALIDEIQTAKTQTVGDWEIVILITTGITLAEDELSEAWMLVNKSNGIGDIYKIRASKVDGTDDTQLRLLLDSPIRTALAATSEITIVKSAWQKVVVIPTTAAERPAGVPLIDVTISYYCWLQTAGPAPLIVDTGETLVLGEPCGYPATPNVAGAVGPIGADTDLQWGIPRTIATAAEVAIVDLQLD